MYNTYEYHCLTIIEIFLRNTFSTNSLSNFKTLFVLLKTGFTMSYLTSCPILIIHSHF